MILGIVVSQLILLLTCLVFYKQILRRIYLYLTDPPHNLLPLISTNKVIELGLKNGPIRKLLILLSDKPGTLSNYNDGKNLNKINIPADIKGSQDVGKRKIWGFFHPYCNAGGGGEKVLWKAIELTLKNDPNNIVVIYTGDLDATREEIFKSVQKRFDYKLDEDRIAMIYLKTRRFVDSSYWNHFTLIGQAIGTMVLTMEAILRCPPDIWCDTMGFPFGYPLVKIFLRIPVTTYTHYPVIQKDMFRKLKSQIKGFYDIKTILKYVYWKIFMRVYQGIGNDIDLVMTNSTWTNRHISDIWEKTLNVRVYPPCSTEKLYKNGTGKWDRKNQMVVIAQFRPEKRYELIINSYCEVYTSLKTKEEKKEFGKLILIGNTRNKEDRRYVQTLKDLVTKKWKMEDGKKVIFECDCPYKDMKKYLRESSFGINAMWNEHFGIGIVEYTAAGLITFAHKSAGPYFDIVVPWDKDKHIEMKENNENTRTGFFFTSEEDPDFKKGEKKNIVRLSDLLRMSLNMKDKEKYEISERAKDCGYYKFSDAEFEKAWNNALRKVDLV